MAGETNYRRPPGSGRFVPMSRARMWLGDDHLLLVGRSLVTESYRRLYFRDIQAVVIRRTAAGKLWNIALFAALGLAFLVGVGAKVPATFVVWCLGLLAAALCLNLALGTTCQCHVKTAVSLQHLPTVRRMRTAQKLLGILRPAILQVQGEAPPEEIRRRVAADRQGGPAEAGALPSRQTDVPVVRHYKGTVHGLLLASLLVGCGLSVMRLLIPGMPLNMLGMLALLSHLGLGIGAVVRQSGSDIPRGLRVTAWLAVGYVLTVYVLNVVGTGLSGDSDNAGMLVGTSRWVTFVNAFSAGAAWLLGAAGLVQLAAFRSRSRRSAAAGPPAVTG